MKNESIKIECIFLVVAFLFLFVIVVSSSVAASSLSLPAQYQPYIKLQPKEGKESIWSMTDEVAERALKIENITGYNGFLTIYAMTSDMDLIPGKFSFSGDPRAKLTRLLGNNNSRQSEYFLSGDFSLVSGTHISVDMQNAALISVEIADMNNYNIGDEIQVDTNNDSVYGNPNAPMASFLLTIMGIFEISYSPEENVSHKPELDIRNNFIFIDAYTAKQIHSFLYEKPYDGYNSGIMFFSSSPADLNQQAEQLLRELEMSDNDVTLILNDGGYSRAISPLLRLNRMLNLILTIIALSGGAVIAMVYYASIRRRFREFGIFISIGISKPVIILQIFIETLLFIIPAIVVSTGIVAFVVNGVDILSMDMKLTLLNVAVLAGYMIALLAIVVIIAAIILVRNKPRDLFLYKI